MRAKIISKLTIVQLACLPLISISCGKHEQKAKENLIAVASSPKFDKLIDKNKEEKDETTPVVEKIEVVNTGESKSKHIEKRKKVEIRNQNNPNSPINVEVKNDIKIDNKINTKESKLKTFFAVIGGLATAAAVGYGLYWLFKSDEIIKITNKTNQSTTEINASSLNNVEIIIEYEYTGSTNSFSTAIQTITGYSITKQTNSLTTSNNHHKVTITIKGTEHVISKK